PCSYYLVEFLLPGRAGRLPARDRPRQRLTRTAASVAGARGHRRGGGLPRARRPLVRSTSATCRPCYPPTGPHGDRPLGQPTGAAPPPGRVRLLRRGTCPLYPRTVHRAAGAGEPRRRRATRVDDRPCYTADTTPCDALDRLATGCRVLLAEASGSDVTNRCRGPNTPGHPTSRARGTRSTGSPQVEGKPETGRELDAPLGAHGRPQAQQARPCGRSRR